MKKVLMTFAIILLCIGTVFSTMYWCGMRSQIPDHTTLTTFANFMQATNFYEEFVNDLKFQTYISQALEDSVYSLSTPLDAYRSTGGGMGGTLEKPTRSVVYSTPSGSSHVYTVTLDHESNRHPLIAISSFYSAAEHLNSVRSSTNPIQAIDNLFDSIADLFKALWFVIMSFCDLIFDAVTIPFKVFGRFIELFVGA